jgi:Spy/CpxP family protein refolding chaperone
MILKEKTMRPKPVILAVLLGWLLLGWSPVFAQPNPGAPSPDPIGQNLFPPDQVFSQAEAIGLTDAQKTSIQSSILHAQSRFLEFQPRLQQAMQRMVKLIGQSRVDESQVLSQLDKVLSVEREIKRTQIGLMTRIKNVLTLEQQAKLRQLRPNP